MGALTTVRTRVLVLLCLAVAGYGMYTAAVGWYRNNQLRESGAEAQANVRELEQTKAYLEAVKAYVASDAYVEQQARRQLGFGREGEVVFVVTSPPIDQDPKQSGAWWERLFPR